MISTNSELPLNETTSGIANLDARARQPGRRWNMVDFALGFGTAAIIAAGLWLALH
jgi:hypothetical protein